ncbi:hypothetical protein KPH14_002909 [Odynerus spinipes]|uniref:Major facilitator superfamily (MFS) profile domain-containing protein n=1 Tax=Odynerus spinipes TaxID=1348599 RepID=A0AAD9RXQ6_9HYME|nr:hypothetical protein KPH14_002909 [Odynerus spinipes]
MRGSRMQQEIRNIPFRYSVRYRWKISPYFLMGNTYYVMKIPPCWIIAFLTSTILIIVDIAGERCDLISNLFEYLIARAIDSRTKFIPVARLHEIDFGGEKERKVEVEEEEEGRGLFLRAVVASAPSGLSANERPTRSVHRIGVAPVERRRKRNERGCPLPTSSSSAVYETTTLDTEFLVEQSNDIKKRAIATLGGVTPKYSALDMAEKGSTKLQYIAAAAANLSVLATGAMLGWTSPSLPKLSEKSDDSPLSVKISKEEESWIAALVAIGAAVGSFVAGYAAERFGRKRSLLFCVVPYTIGWALIATASAVAQFYVARLIFGFALSFVFTIVPMYCGEIAEISIRGALGSFLQLFITIGLLYAYVIGPYVTYTVFWIVCSVLPVVFFICFLIMPESPYYLISKGNREEAVAALAKLRSKSEAAVQKEADEMQAAAEEAMKAQTKISDLFTVKANFKALLFTSLLVSFQQLTGINVVLFYMQNIFKDAGSSQQPHEATMIVGAVQVVASFVTPFIVDRLGRRLLLVVSGIGEIVTLGALGLCFYLRDVLHEDVSGISWLPVVSLVIFIATYCIGWGPLPWAVMGEMFAPDVKSKASGITVCMCWLLAFFIIKFSSNITEAFGDYTTYWMFAAFCLLSVLFTVFILPETKGKSLQQIQDELNGVNPSVSEFGDLAPIKK